MRLVTRRKGKKGTVSGLSRGIWGGGSLRSYWLDGGGGGGGDLMGVRGCVSAPGPLRKKSGGHVYSPTSHAHANTLHKPPPPPLINHGVAARYRSGRGRRPCQSPVRRLHRPVGLRWDAMTDRRARGSGSFLLGVVDDALRQCNPARNGTPRPSRGELTVSSSAVSATRSIFGRCSTR